MLTHHLFSVSCRVLHIDQHLSHPSADGLHGEGGLLHDNVPDGLHTLAGTGWDEPTGQRCCRGTEQKLLMRWERLLPTWPVGPGLLGVEFGSQRGTRLQFGLGELGQVRHDRVLVHVGVDDLLRCDHLTPQIKRESAKGRLGFSVLLLARRVVPYKHMYIYKYMYTYKLLWAG